jgi:hypothetical protein
LKKNNNKDHNVFIRVEERNERGEMVTDNTPATFEIHMPPIIEEETEKNRLR